MFRACRVNLLQVSGKVCGFHMFPHRFGENLENLKAT